MIKKPLTWSVGGKTSCASWIHEHMPKRPVFIDAMGGSGIVLMSREPSCVEIYNDLNPELTNLLRVVQTFPELLASEIEKTPSTSDAFEISLMPHTDPVERARRYLTKFWQGTISPESNRYVRNFVFNTRYYLQREVGMKTLVDRIYDVSARLQQVSIQQLDVVDLIRKYDGPDVLFFIDPPPPDPKNEDYYAEPLDILTTEKHRELALTLNSIEGSAVLCGNRSRIYRELYSSWSFARMPAKFKVSAKHRGLWISPNTEDR